MSRSLLMLALTVAAWTSADAAAKPWTMDDILRLRDVTEVQVAPDGRSVLFVVSESDDEGNSFNTDLYLTRVLPPAPAATPLEPVRLTRSPKADHEPRWSPNGTRIAFLSARETKKPESGSAEEKSEQLWLIRPDGGEPWNPARMSGDVHHFAWSPDSTTLAVLVRDPKSEDRTKREKDKDDAVVVDRDVRRDQVWLMDAATGASVQVTRGEIHFSDLDWSPDGTKLALSGQPTPKVPDEFRSDIYVLDLSKARSALAAEMGRKELKEERKETPAAEPLATPRAIVTTKGADANPRWAPDGESIAYVTQDGSDEWYTNSYAAIVPASGGNPNVVTRAFDEEVDNVRFAPDGRSLLFEANQRFARKIFRVSTTGGSAQELTPGDDLHRQLSTSRDGRVAAFVREGAGSPAEVVVAEVSAGGALSSVRTLTSLNGFARELDTIVKEPYRWKGAGGLDIEGLLVKPRSVPAGGKLPLLVIVHGGPAGVFNNNFSVRRGPYPVQIFAQQGFAVLMPNPRGSGGYGEAFRKANVRDWGEKDYEDILAGVDALVASGQADPDRLGIMGWSYGGFMTSRVISKTRRFKAASVGAGVTNAFSFTGVTDIPPFMRSYFGAWPWEDTGVYASHTALFNAKGITTPTLIQHGESDARVPISQGWELYVALEAQGVPVEFVTYPRQGHGIQEPKLVRDAMRRNVEWFERWVPAKPTSDSR